MADRRPREVRHEVIHEYKVNERTLSPHNRRNRHAAPRKRSPSPQRKYVYEQQTVDRGTSAGKQKSRMRSPPPNSKLTRVTTPPKYNAPPPPQQTSSAARQPPPTQHEANKTNLHVWGQWRTEVNENLIGDFLNTADRRRQKKRVQPLETKIKNGGVYDYKSKTDQTRGLMNYSLSTNRITDLEPNAFLRYGIPRAKINADNREYRKLWPNEEQQPTNTLEKQQPRQQNGYTNGITDMTDSYNSFDTIDSKTPYPPTAKQKPHDATYASMNTTSKVRSTTSDAYPTGHFANLYHNGGSESRGGSQRPVANGDVPTRTGNPGHLPRGNGGSGAGFPSETPRTDYSATNGSAPSRGGDDEFEAKDPEYSSVGPGRRHHRQNGGGVGIPQAPPPPPVPPPLPPLPPSVQVHQKG